METLVAALVVGTAAVLAALIQRSDRNHGRSHDDLHRGHEDLRREVAEFRAEVRDALTTLSLRIDRLYDRTT